MSSQRPTSNPYRAPGAREEQVDTAGTEPRRRTGLWLGIGTAAVVVLAVLGVTAFAYPGWFLDPGPGPTKPHHVVSGPRDAGRTARGTTNTALDALNATQLRRFGRMSCPSQRARMLRTVRDNDPRLAPGGGDDVDKIGVDYELNTLRSRGANTAVATFTERFDNLPKHYRRLIPHNRFDGTLTLTRSGGQWQPCGISFRIPGNPTQPENPPR